MRADYHLQRRLISKPGPYYTILAKLERECVERLCEVPEFKMLYQSMYGDLPYKRISSEDARAFIDKAAKYHKARKTREWIDQPSVWTKFCECWAKFGSRE